MHVCIGSVDISEAITVSNNVAEKSDIVTAKISLFVCYPCMYVCMCFCGEVLCDVVLRGRHLLSPDMMPCVWGRVARGVAWHVALQVVLHCMMPCMRYRMHANVACGFAQA